MTGQPPRRAAFYRYLPPLVLLLALFCTLPGCAGPAPHAEKALDRVVWPPPPLEPRVAWVASISGPDDLAGGKGFWKRVSAFIFGEEKVRIARPYGVYADRERRLLVADPGGKAVHLIERAQGRYRVLRGEEVGGFLSPIGVTADGRGEGYVTDSAAGKVYRFSLSSSETKPFITQGVKRPTGIAFNPVNELLYVSDTVAGQVVTFTLEGKEAFRFGAPGESPGQFNRPTDLAVDGQGRVAVTDALNGRIQIFSADGVFLKDFGRPGDVSGSFAKAKGVAFDSRGQLHVCDALFDTVQVFNEQGVLLLSYGARGDGHGELWMPSGIFIDAHDTVYVADTYNNRVQIFQYLSTLTE
ncbi:MAG: 6-bladed beta-propeller [Geobacter sp.]|nr:MAG: 6-bladed beta-propeller [Geobacter sp.]